MNNEQAVKRVLSDYYNAFSTLDVQFVLPYFHQPALLIGPLGVIAIPTPAAVVPIFGPVMEDLRQRKYRRSGFVITITTRRATWPTPISPTGLRTL
jgi:hypothetical protein